METQNNNQQQPQNKNTTMAIIAYLIFFIPLLTDAKNDPFVKFHVKQGLVLTLTAILVNVILSFGFFFSFYYIAPLLHLAILALVVIGIVNASSGKEKELPLIGQFAKNINF